MHRLQPEAQSKAWLPSRAHQTRLSKVYLVQDHSRVEHKVGVKEGLELPHQVICLAAPFHLNKRSNIAACTMLTLQTTNKGVKSSTRVL